MYVWGDTYSGLKLGVYFVKMNILWFFINDQIIPAVPEKNVQFPVWTVHFLFEGRCRLNSCPTSPKIAVLANVRKKEFEFFNDIVSFDLLYSCWNWMCRKDVRRRYLNYLLFLSLFCVRKYILYIWLYLTCINPFTHCTWNYVYFYLIYVFMFIYIFRYIK